MSDTKKHLVTAGVDVQANGIGVSIFRHKIPLGETEALRADLGDKPFVYPGNLNATQFEIYLREVANNLWDVRSEQETSDAYQRNAPIYRRNFEESRLKFLEEAGLLSQAATLFPESQKTEVSSSFCVGDGAPEPDEHQRESHTPPDHPEGQKTAAQRLASR